MSIDVLLDESGDITVPTAIAQGEALVIQRARGRTETYLHDWILDTRKGVPWLRWLEQREKPLQEIEDFLRAEYEGIAGVSRASVVASLADDMLSVDIEAQLYLTQDDAGAGTLLPTPPPDRPVTMKATVGIL